MKYDEGVITLADKHFFTGFVLLYESIQNSYPVPVTCFDGGLTSKQKQWANNHLSNCTILPIPDNENTRLINDKLGGTSKLATKEAKLWMCPFLIQSSPYRRVIWLDSDLIVIGKLQALFALLDAGPVFTPSNHEPHLVKNKTALYNEMPLRDCANTTQPRVNAGVSGWDCVRDQEVINDYTAPAIKACSNKVVRQSIKWHDQGCLIWAIQNNCLHHQVQATPKWNLCAIHTNKNDDYKADMSLNQQLQTAYPGANIVHWNHAPLQHKLFTRLGSEADILDSVLQRISES